MASIAESDPAMFSLRRLLALVLVVSLVALMTALGFWQLDRAGQKRHLLTEQAERGARAPVPMVWDRDDYSDQRFLPVRVRGAWLHGRDFLLDNQVLKGRPGFHLLTPWRSPDSGRLLLVDRGWLPAGARRDVLPPLPGPGHERVLTGTLYVPMGMPFSLGPAFDSERWPRIVQYIDFDAFSQALGQPVLPVILRLRTPPSGLVQEWPLSRVRPERHVAYAIQWFAMASVLALLGALFMTRKKDDHHD